MGLRPTRRNESAFLRFIDSKRVTRDFRRSAIAWLHKLSRLIAQPGFSVVDYFRFSSQSLATATSRSRA
jgi:hypothetical protein